MPDNSDEFRSRAQRRRDDRRRDGIWITLAGALAGAALPAVLVSQAAVLHVTIPPANQQPHARVGVFIPGQDEHSFTTLEFLDGRSVRVFGCAQGDAVGEQRAEVITGALSDGSKGYVHLGLQAVYETAGPSIDCASGLLTVFPDESGNQQPNVRLNSVTGDLNGVTWTVTNPFITPLNQRVESNGPAQLPTILSRAALDTRVGQTLTGYGASTDDRAKAARLGRP